MAGTLTELEMLTLRLMREQSGTEPGVSRAPSRVVPVRNTPAFAIADRTIDAPAHRAAARAHGDPSRRQDRQRRMTNRLRQRRGVRAHAVPDQTVTVVALAASAALHLARDRSP